MYNMRFPVREPLDLADIVIEAASELEPASRDHALELDVQPTPVVGNRDDLQRVAMNLIENALRHTPPGTRVTASTRPLPDGTAELVVARRRAGHRAGRARLRCSSARPRPRRPRPLTRSASAIVAAVVTADNDTVAVDESPHGGARFTSTLTALAVPADVEQHRPSPTQKPSRRSTRREPGRSRSALDDHRHTIGRRR